MLGTLRALLKSARRSFRANVKLVRGAKPVAVWVGCSMKPVMWGVSRVLLKWSLPFMLWPCIFWVPGFILADVLGIEFYNPRYILGVNVEPTIQSLCNQFYFMTVTVPIGGSGLLLGLLAAAAHILLPSSCSNSSDTIEPLVEGLEEY